MMKKLKRGEISAPRTTFSLLLLSTSLLFGASCVEVVQGQEISSSLQIISPATGNIFAPGDTIPVTVSVTDGSPYLVGVIGEGIGLSNGKNIAPYTFSLIVPKTLCGPRKLTAYELSNPGVGVFSAPVTVDIEPNTQLASLSVAPTVVGLKFPQAQLPLRVVGAFEDGTTQDITACSQTSYASKESRIVSVSSAGIVTALRNGPANTVVIVSFGGSSASIPVSIPAPIPFSSFSPVFMGSSQAGIVRGTFSLGIGSDGISPSVEPVTIQIGARQIFIPANSFTEDERGKSRVNGTFEDVKVHGWIAATQKGQFEFQFEMNGLAAASISKSPAIQLFVGDDAGAATARSNP